MTAPRPSSDAWSNTCSTLAEAAASTDDMVANTDRLRRAVGRMQADEALDLRQIGAVLAAWLHEGGDLVAALGVRPRIGSRVTPQALVLQDRQDHLLMALSRAAGSDAKALRMLIGEIAIPAAHQQLLEDARDAKCPASRTAFTRARQRIASSRMT
jgi:hypothetical protein